MKKTTLDIDDLLAFHRAAFGGARMEEGQGDSGTAGTGQESGQQGTGQQASGQTSDQGRGTQGQQTAQGGEKTEPGSVEELPEWAQKLIRDTRKEAGDHRTAKSAAEQQKTAAEAKQQELLDGIAQALGLKKDDAPPDPAVLQRTLSERESRIGTLESDSRTKDVELAAWRSASRQGANALALLDSRSFLADVSRIDPAADDFGAQIDAAVKKALDANAALRANPLPTPGQAGIGVTGSGPEANVKPGMGRLRQAYSTNK
jgi:hypothetical protein